MVALTSDGRQNEELDVRSGKASAVLQALHNSVVLTLEGPSTSIDVFSFQNACKMASVKSYDTIFSEFYF